MHDGRIHFDGPAEEFEHPEDPLVRRFVRGDPERPVALGRGGRTYWEALHRSISEALAGSIGRRS